MTTERYVVCEYATDCYTKFDDYVAAAEYLLDAHDRGTDPIMFDLKTGEQFTVKYDGQGIA